MSHDARQHRFMTILCFGLVYLFWGSTYLALDIAIQKIPPALMCGVRFTIAGLLILGWCKLRGQDFSYRPKQLVQIAAVGLLLMMGGNMTLAYSELHVPTGLAALLIAITPLWFLVLDSLLLGHHRVSGRGAIGLGLGIVGTIVLLWPDLASQGRLHSLQFWFSLALLAGSFSWALGSVMSKRWGTGASLSTVGFEILFAGLGCLLLSLARGDWGHVVWTAQGMGAILYLIVCGSLIGYTAYTWLVTHVPTSKMSTYAYVNPVIAVFLGWLVLHESINGYILAGSAIVVASVILVTSAPVKTVGQVTTVAEEMPAVEGVGD